MQHPIIDRVVNNQLPLAASAIAIHIGGHSATGPVYGEYKISHQISKFVFLTTMDCLSILSQKYRFRNYFKFLYFNKTEFINIADEDYQCNIHTLSFVQNFILKYIF